jgi:Flp pilus assembly protein TadG
MTRRARNDARTADRGAAAVILLLLTPVLFAAAGLVWDGGRAITARQGAADLAEQAARAGANVLDVTALRATGADVLDPGPAQLAACAYVATAAPGDPCRASVGSDSVTVTVTTSTPTVLLGLLGIDTFHTTGTATAAPVTGILTRQTGP